MNALASMPSPQVMPAVLKLFRLRWRIWFNSFRHSRLRAKIGMLIAVIGVLALAGVAFVVTWLILKFLGSPELKTYFPEVETLLAFTNSLPVAILGAAFLGVFLTSFGGLLQALYLSGDMDFLLAAPIPMRAVFVSKLLQAILPTFALVLLMGLPVIYGLGAANGYNVLYYFIAPVIMGALTFSGAGVAGLIVIAVARVFPARRVAEVLGFLAAIFSMVCSQSGNFMRFSNVDVSDGQFDASSLNLVSRFNSPWMPLAWAGRGLVDLGAGQWLSGLALLALTLGLAAGLFGLALVTAERMYYTGWANMQVVARKRKAPRAAPSAAALDRKIGTASQWVSRFIPAPVRAIVVKDVLVLRRDLRHLSQLITPLIFGVLYALMFLRSGGEPPAGRGEAPSWFMEGFRSIMSYGNVALSVFMGWMLMSRLAGMGFSQEGKNYWMLKTAPVGAGRLLLAKFLVAYLPTLALSEVYLLGVSILQGVSISAFAYSLVAVALCLAGMGGILLGFGAAGANLNWEDPRKMNAGNLGCLGMFLTVLFVPIAFGLFIGPLLLTAFFEWSELAGYLVGLIAGGSVCLAGAVLPPWLAKNRVERLGEG